MSDDGEPEGTFAIFFAEGEILAKQGQFTKAIDSFSRALEFQPEDKLCLVSRSKCYLHLGNTALALKDSEDSLKENEKYHKGLYQKAEVLYAMGNFENALVFYHRGHKIRPELYEFTLGIQKAQEAIINSIGTPDHCKLEKVGDLSYFQQQDNLAKKKTKKILRPQVAQQKKERKPVASEKTIKELLGELYSDREYLDKLMKDPSLVLGQKDHSIYDAAEDALIYLDARTEFWRQQKPIYARKREKELKKFRPPPTKPREFGKHGAGPVDHTKYVIKCLEDIDSALSNGDAEGSLAQAEKLMKTVKGLNDKDLPNKLEFVASLHSCIANAHLETGEGELALNHHLKDLEIGEELQHVEIKSRALDNIGRVYAVIGDFRKASVYWGKKLPLITTTEESAWLHHELGRCQLELGDLDEALELGQKSLKAAKQCNDQMWQLNAGMLVAQVQSRLGDSEAAVEAYEEALDLANQLREDGTEQAIKMAIEEVRGKEGKKEEEVKKRNELLEKAQTVSISVEGIEGRVATDTQDEDTLSEKGSKTTNKEYDEDAESEQQDDSAKSNRRREQSRDILSAKSSKTEKREGSAKSSEGSRVSIKDMSSEGSEKRPESAKSKTSEGSKVSLKDIFSEGSEKRLESPKSKTGEGSKVSLEDILSGKSSKTTNEVSSAKESDKEEP